MAINRRPFQGVVNIIRFNWHFYLIVGILLLALFLLKNMFPTGMQNLLLIGVGIGSLTIISSLLISFYIYDLSTLYELKWLENAENKKILNINTGFDETSEIITSKFSNVDLTICDFYDPSKHTEISIKRARLAYPPYPKTISVPTDQLPFSSDTFDKSIAILSAHEIREEAERIQFFKELNRITKSSGQIIVTEHLRDVNNFLAYTIGFFHFHSKKCWLKTFKAAKLTLKEEIKTTPFITTFILENNGHTL